MKKILLVGSIGAQNLGDDLLLETVAQNYAHDTIYLFSEKASLDLPHEKMAPFPFGIRSFLSFSWVKTFVTLKRIDKVIFIGGGLWDDHDGARGPFMWLLYYFIFNLYRKDILLLGQSFALKRKYLARIFSVILKHLSLSPDIKWYFRDEVSLKRFSQLVPFISAKLGVDSLFLRGKKDFSFDTNTIDTILMNIHESYSVLKAKNILLYFQEKYKIILISTDIKDILFYEKHFSEYPRILLKKESELLQFKGHSAVLAMRLHLAILTLDWPQWILAYSAKVQDFFHSEWVCSLEDDVEDFLKKDPCFYKKEKQDFYEKEIKKALDVCKEINV